MTVQNKVIYGLSNDGVTRFTTIQEKMICIIINLPICHDFEGFCHDFDRLMSWVYKLSKRDSFVKNNSPFV